MTTNKKGGAMKMLEGGLIGAALGVAAGLFLNSQKGKELREAGQDKLADFYSYVAPKVKKIKKMGEKEFADFMDNAAEQYAKLKKITVQESKELAEQTKKTWGELKKHVK